MPRIQVDPREIDTSFAIEEAIEEVFKGSNIARVAISSIEKEYDVFNDNNEVVPSTLEEKCQHLSLKLAAAFEIKDGDVWFRLPPDYPRKRAK